MAEVEFDVRYEGPALESSEMNVRDLAPALLSTADLFREANARLNPGHPDVSVNIRATSAGSFIVDLKLVHDDLRNIFTSEDAQAGAALLALLGFVGGTIRFVRQKQRRRIATTEPAAHGRVVVTLDDGVTLEIENEVLALAQSRPVMQNLANVVAPLERDGVENVTFRQAGEEIASVGKSDLAFFEPEPEGRTELTVNESDVVLVIVAPAFEPELQWRFSDGGSRFTARVLDEQFNARVEAGERFGKGDELLSTLRRTQWHDGDGDLHIDIEIVRVIDHRPAGGPPDVQQLFDASQFHPGS